MVSDSPRIIRIIIFLAVMFGFIWLIILLFSKAFSGGNNTSIVERAPLSSYARAGTEVQYTFDGRIVANQKHRSLRISVDASQSKIELMQGYDNHVIRQEVFPNTQESYLNFLNGLDTLGFSRGDDTIKQDERGQCPLQHRYVYLLREGGTDVFRYWRTSCGTGSFKGIANSVNVLFQRQIPPKVYNEFMRDFNRP
ncbi:hypothetical protein CSA80_04515 [Candidatus Saccharibacteria bacterium]|nr:MAG: hypothetical protein CR973_01410 [Candidatus Saccharibacteria bacterium]PID98931.1 MAG: hypothetical protein CSA80_04515 [Candidatus Saccharibacteria bacterium]